MSRRIAEIAGVLVALALTGAVGDGWTVRPIPRPVPEAEARARFRPPPRPVRVTPTPQGPTRTRPLPRPENLANRVPPDTAGPPDPTRPRPRPAGLPTVRTVSKPKPPPSAVPTAPVRPPAPAGPVDVVMIGDSITAGGHWAAHFPGVRIANRGVNSDTALKILQRMDGIYRTRPKRALLMFGINDIYNGVPEARIVQRYDRIVSLLKARRIDVVIQATLACGGETCGEKLARVHSLNARLRKLARKHRVAFVDINRALADRGGLKPVYSRDGIHLNGKGYARWYAVLKPVIERS